MHRDMEFNEIMLIQFFFNRIKAQRTVNCLDQWRGTLAWIMKKSR